VTAPPGVSVERHGAVRAATRASLGVPTDGRLLVCVVDAASRPRVATVLRTASLLARRHPGLRLALLGGGADDEHLRTHAAALGITPLVQFLGEREDHLAVLSAADVGWVTAEQDDAAWAFLDIMAMRVPTLAERAPLAEVYVHDGIGGLLLPRGDANAAAAAIAALLCDEDRRQAMGRAAHGRVAREFTETRMAEGFERAATVARDRAP
jgi:glycosyltransferase involved in cell wall biosynthesis